MHPQDYGELKRASLTPDHFLDDDGAADMLSVSRSYLKKLRVYGGGPRFSKLGNKAVRYRVGDLISWASSKSVTSTSELEAA